ncbi:MAG: hypothetical protein JWO86_2203 [Myxococcaceae bacterium]|nr:hypothetical protein [Myxococcaceae bacterium]
MTAQLFVLLGDHAVGQLTRDNAGSLLAHRGLAVLTAKIQDRARASARVLRSVGR